MNAFNEAFPDLPSDEFGSCGLEVRENDWPPIPGEYYVFRDGTSRPVAVSTLANTDLAEALADARPPALCIAGKTETENIGIDKVIKNTIANPAIRFLILAGKDPKGHRSGDTLLALWENGIDQEMKVKGSPGKHAILKNVTREEVETFRKQVQIVDMIGCEDVNRVLEEIKKLARTVGPASIGPVQGPVAHTVPTFQAQDQASVELDKAGYFVIIPDRSKRSITVEFYAYDHSLLGVVIGSQPKSIYFTIIEKGWITLLSHAAYLGKELARAEFSLEMGLKYTQDGA